MSEITTFITSYPSGDKLSFIITIISILLGFVLSISSYLVSTSIPNTSFLSLKGEKDSIKIIKYLQDLIKEKESLSKKNSLFYIVLGLNLIFLIFIQNYGIFTIFVICSFLMFVFCLYHINKIIKLNLKITNISKDILIEDFKNNSKKNLNSLKK